MTETIPWHPAPPGSFRAFSEAVQRIAATQELSSKIAVTKDYLATLGEEINLKPAIQFLNEKPPGSKPKIAAGQRTIGLSAAEFCGIDYERVFKPCRSAMGSTSATIQKLMENIPEAQSRRTPKIVLLSEVQQWLNDLKGMRERKRKSSFLHELWEQLTGLEIRYLLCIISREPLQTGLGTWEIAEAVARAFDEDIRRIRYVYMISGSLERTAVLASQHNLDSARFRLFHPLSFMTVSPAGNDLPKDLANYTAEVSLDGIRCQLQANGHEIRLFSRDYTDITTSFPEIDRLFRRKNLPPVVLDGVICVYREGTIHPGVQLQKRLDAEKHSGIPGDPPALFLAHDILFTEGEMLIGLPLSQRRTLLTGLCERHRIPCTIQHELQHPDDARSLLDLAVSGGNTGLILKRKDSLYECGQWGSLWIKVREPGGSLVTVVMYVHSESGTENPGYTGFTAGVYVGDDKRYEEQFIPIGRVYGKFPDKELKWLQKQIERLATERFGPTLALRPEIVVEVEFAKILENRRTKANYVLQSPRLKAICRDPGQYKIATLADVEQLYRQKQEIPLRGEQKPSSFWVNAARVIQK